MKEEEIKEMLIALKNNWTIDFAKMEELCDYCLTTINQLQSYKQKEDKIREYIEKYNKVNAEKADTNADRLTMLINADDLLQILNEGSDENE